jgi:predicted HNH restriction endonuclease
MSRKIEEIVEVIQHVRDEYQRHGGSASISSTRREAVTLAAKRRRVFKQTVLDKFIRQLQPDVAEAAHFDDLLVEWLVDDSDELESILRRHTRDRADVELLDRVFEEVSPADVLLAQEFGCDPNDASFGEGKEQLRLHLRRERSRRLVAVAKQKWNREQGGQVRCSICSFSFPQTYGKVGEDFIEAHHTRPLSAVARDATTTVADLIPVCSNCHSMLHRNRPWLTAEDLHSIVSEQRR